MKIIVKIWKRIRFESYKIKFPWKIFIAFGYFSKIIIFLVLLKSKNLPFKYNNAFKKFIFFWTTSTVFQRLTSKKILNLALCIARLYVNVGIINKLFLLFGTCHDKTFFYHSFILLLPMSWWKKIAAWKWHNMKQKTSKGFQKNCDIACIVVLCSTQNIFFLFPSISLTLCLYTSIHILLFPSIIFFSISGSTKKKSQSSSNSNNKQKKSGLWFYVDSFSLTFSYVPYELNSMGA